MGRALETAEKERRKSALIGRLGSSTTRAAHSGKNHVTCTRAHLRTGPREAVGESLPSRARSPSPPPRILVGTGARLAVSQMLPLPFPRVARRQGGAPAAAMTEAFPPGEPDEHVERAQSLGRRRGRPGTRRGFRGEAGASARSSSCTRQNASGPPTTKNGAGTDRAEPRPEKSSTRFCVETADPNTANAARGRASLSPARRMNRTPLSTMEGSRSHDPAPARGRAASGCRQPERSARQMLGIRRRLRHSPPSVKGRRGSAQRGTKSGPPGR